MSFTLDAKLAADTLPVAVLDLCELRLMDDGRYPWLILIPRKEAAVEILDLNPEDQAALFAEITAISRILKSVTACHKLNVAALGNVVRQLHVHVIARFTQDAAWPQPVWGVGKRVVYEPPARDRMIAQILAELPA